MDSEDLSPTLLRAGEQYLKALRELRLEPEGLLWSRLNVIREINNINGQVDEIDSPGGDWHLVLVTSAVDEGGPSELNELLFKAYDASATPIEISPFIVEVMSAKSPFVQRLLIALNSPVGPTSMHGTDPDGRKFEQALDPFSAQTMLSGLWFDRKWIYYLTGLRPPYAERKRHWREFRQSVNSLAA